MNQRFLLLGCVFVACFVGGCRSKEVGVTSSDTSERFARLEEIQLKTRGDWNRLTQGDKSYLVNDLSHGSESNARLLLGPLRPAKPGSYGTN